MEKKKRVQKLPVGYRNEVAEILLQKGLHYSAYTITNVMRNRVKDHEKVANVLAAVKIVKARHARKQKQIQALRQSVI